MNRILRAPLLALLVLLFAVAAVPAHAAPLALFDECHAQCVGNANWTITGGFSDFADSFRHLGFAVEAIKQGPITAEMLKRSAVLVLGEPNTRYTDDEERAIVDWVKAGGSLYLIADHIDSDRDNDGFDSVKIFNRFTGQFGFEFEPAWIRRLSPIPVTPGVHEILHGVPAVGLWGGTVVRVNGDPAEGVLAVGYKDKDGAEKSGYYLALAHPGKGRVVALGDSSPYDDGTADHHLALVHDGYNLIDHGFRQLAHNTIAWLARRDIRSARIPFDIRLNQPPLNTSPDKPLAVPFRVEVTPDAAGAARVDYYLRGVAPENRLGSRNVTLKPGMNDIGFNFKYTDQGLFRVYADIVHPTVKVPGRAFTSIKVGRIPRLLIDRSHQNDWTNRMRAFATFLDDEGIFRADARKALAPELAKPDINVLVMSAPKKGVTIGPDTILALIEFMKRDGTLVLVGTADSGQWGDSAAFRPLIDALNLPLSFNDDTVLVNDPGKNSSLAPVGGLPSPVGEAPVSLVGRQGGRGTVTPLAYAPQGSTQKDGDGDGFFDYAGKPILVDAMVDMTGTALGGGRVLFYGSCHLSDWCFKPELRARQAKYLTATLRGALCKQEIVPVSQILATYPDGMVLTVTGVVKAFDGRTLLLEDSGKQMACAGAFPQGFVARVGSIVRVHGRLVKKGNWFDLAVLPAPGK